MENKICKGKSRLVWTSFGIAMEYLPFLKTYEQIKMQKLNLFYYTIAISRVQHTVNLEGLEMIPLIEYRNEGLTKMFHVNPLNALVYKK